MLKPYVITFDRPVVFKLSDWTRAVRVTAAVLALGVVVTLWSRFDPAPVPEDAKLGRTELAAAIERTPADRRLYDRAAEMALDLRDAPRHDLWLEAHDMSRRLAPDWPTAQTGFIRGAFLHWPELNGADRALVEREASVLLSTPDLFQQYWSMIWVATGDLDMFLEAAPKDAATRIVLARLAANKGDFDEYRKIRDNLARRRATDLAASPPASSEQVLQHLLSIPRTPAMRALMNVDLRYLDRNRPEGKTIDPGGIRRFVEYALDNHLSPLQGLFEIDFSPTLLPPTLRARLAVAMDNTDLADRVERSEISAGNLSTLTRYRADRAMFEISRGNVLEAQSQLSRIPETDQDGDIVLAARAEVARAARNSLEEEEAEGELLSRIGPATIASRWSGTCQRVLCRSLASVRFYTATPLSIDLPVEALQTDQTGEYLEVALDGRLVDEGVVKGDRDFRIDVPGRGLHTIEIRVVNPIRRTWGPRTVVELGVPVTSIPAKKAPRSPDDTSEVSPPGDQAR